MGKILNKLIILLVLILVFVAIHQCNTKPRVEIKETIDIERIIDSLKSTIKIPEPIKDTVYLDSIVYLKSAPIKIKGKDTIIYKTDTVKIPVQVKRYDPVLESNDAIARLSIYTSGTLYKVDGTIEYDKTTITKEITKYKNNSGFFLYAETSLFDEFSHKSIGIDYQIRNSIILGVSVGHDKFQAKIDDDIFRTVSKTSLNAKLGVNIFNKKR